MNDTKFCTGCQMTRPKEGGIIKRSGKVNRWQCKPCQEKRSFSPYTKGEKMIDFNPPSARNNDYETSHAAAVDASFKASEHRLLALRTLHRYGPLTDYELSARTGLQQNSIGKRRKDCQDAGLVDVYLNEIGEKVKRPAPSGSNALVWTITAEGISFITAYDSGNK